MSAKAPLLLVGAGGHAVSCIDVVEQLGRFDIVGLIGSPAEQGKSVLGHTVIGTDADLLTLAARYENVLIAVGQIKTPEPRRQLFEKLQGVCHLPAIVSPRAYLSPHAKIGEGSIVMHGAVVNANTSIGRSCILNSQSLVEHDAIVEDHCHVATGAAVNGNALIGTGSFIGSRSCVKEGVRVGANCVIGMGQRVLADCAAGTWLKNA